jgi:hypothetical protein
MNAHPGSANFSNATFRLDRDNRNLFRDEARHPALLPLWQEDGRRGVLVTTPETAPEALRAARMIQGVLDKFPGPRPSRLDNESGEVVASFKRGDFDASLMKARELLKR